MRPAYWTRRPLNAIGTTGNRVSSAGQSKPSLIRALRCARGMAGIEMITTELSIIVIIMLSVVLDRATKR